MTIDFSTSSAKERVTDGLLRISVGTTVEIGIFITITDPDEQELSTVDSVTLEPMVKTDVFDEIQDGLNSLVVMDPIGSLTSGSVISLHG